MSATVFCMAKSLIVLVLMTTQFLTGISGSVYLCISNDGSYCCIDAGPASCECCHEPVEPSHDACCAEPGCEVASEFSCEAHDEDSPQPDRHSFAAVDPCGCTHVPVMVSSDQPTTVARSSTAVDVERLSLLIALPLTLGSGLEIAVPSPHIHWSGPPAVPNFSLTVISTVVIRC